WRLPPSVVSLCHRAYSTEIESARAANSVPPLPNQTPACRGLVTLRFAGSGQARSRLGRVGAKRAGWGSCGDPLTDPHPQPLPTRGRGGDRACQHGRRSIHCAVTPDAFTTAVQCGISAATKAAKSRDEPILSSKPSFFMLAIISGDCSAALIAALSLSTTSAGGPAGAHIPAPNSRGSSGGPNSVMGGTWGKWGWGCGVDMASALILPSGMSGSTVAGVGQ